MLEERWDTRNVVTFQSSLLRDLRSAASVAKSRALALSSRIRISGFLPGTGNGKSLFLTAGKVFTVLFQHKIKLFRFPLYHLFSLCCGKCLPQILVRGIFPTPFQIVPDRTFEKSCLLGNNADSGAEITSGVIFNILTISRTVPLLAS